MSLKPSAFFNSKEVIAIAHRGGDGAGHEKRNTLAAFESAYKSGYRYFETDVFTSKDGKVVINHGVKNPLELLARAGYSNKHLQRLTYRQIRSKYKVSGEPMPLLEEIIKTFPDVKIFIDPKTDEVISPLVGLARTLKLNDRICVGSFQYDRVKSFADQMGGWDQVCTSFISRAVARPIKYKFEGSCLQISHRRLSEKVVQQIHANGLRVISWTPNDERSIAQSLKIRVDGIISDNIGLLSKTIKDLNTSK